MQHNLEHHSSPVTLMKVSQLTIAPIWLILFKRVSHFEEFKKLAPAKITHLLAQEITRLLITIVAETQWSGKCCFVTDLWKRILFVLDEFTYHALVCSHMMLKNISFV